MLPDVDHPARSAACCIQGVPASTEASPGGDLPGPQNAHSAPANERLAQDTHRSYGRRRTWAEQRYHGRVVPLTSGNVCELCFHVFPGRWSWRGKTGNKASHEAPFCRSASHDAPSTGQPPVRHPRFDRFAEPMPNATCCQSSETRNFGLA